VNCPHTLPPSPAPSPSEAAAAVGVASAPALESWRHRGAATGSTALRPACTRPAPRVYVAVRACVNRFPRASPTRRPMCTWRSVAAAGAHICLHAHRASMAAVCRARPVGVFLERRAMGTGTGTGGVRLANPRGCCRVARVPAWWGVPSGSRLATAWQCTNGQS